MSFLLRKNLDSEMKSSRGVSSWNWQRVAGDYLSATWTFTVNWGVYCQVTPSGSFPNRFSFQVVWVAHNSTCVQPYFFRSDFTGPMVNFLNAKGQTTSEPRLVNIKKSGTLTRTPSYSNTMRALRTYQLNAGNVGSNFIVPRS